MTFTEQQVETIVLEVLRRLGLVESSSQNTGSELSLADHVVTMRSVEGRLTGINRLTVDPRAVVTPAVKDELKQRHIELVRRGSP